MAKLSYEEFKALLMNPNVPDSDIAPYLTAIPEQSGPFDPRIVPDPAKVQMTAEGDFDVESAIRWGNAISRWRRQNRFHNQIANGVMKPLLVSEGDSWFQFPFLIDDVVDLLGTDFLIWSLDAAGDTSDNMVNRQPEYKAGLDEQKANNVAAFMFSGAGNDVIGEDLLGNAALSSLLKDYSPGHDAAWHVNKAQLGTVLTRLETDYRKVISTIRLDAAFASLPIIIHGYDYVIPGGFPGDTRNPIYAKQDEWLGGPMKDKGIQDTTLQRAIVRVLIDALYDMLKVVAGDSSATKVYLVDVRGTLGADEWADEIHGTSAGFKKVAARFATVINGAI
jgi:hypothetical protein